MRFLTPLGFIALISIIILLLIHLIKPTYKSKVITSTYIWQESLKYKKTPKHDNKIKSILILANQILICLLITLILATTVLNLQGIDNSNQSIFVLDASASMNYGSDATRFNRAKELLKNKALESLNANKPVSIIKLSKKATVIANKERNIDTISEILAKTLPTYEEDSIEEAVKLLNVTLKANPNSEISLFTDKNFTNEGEIKVYNVALENENNYAILDAKGMLVDNYYEFIVDVASYGEDSFLTVILDVNGINESIESKQIKMRVNAKKDRPTRLKFTNTEIYEFTSASIKILEADGLPIDNSYYIPNSKKDEIKIQYCSKKPNNFFVGALEAVGNTHSDFFDVSVDTVMELEKAENKGYDLYIYEHMDLRSLPSDGAVMLVNPETLPSDSGIKIYETKSGNFTFTKAEESKLTNNLDISKIEAIEYKRLMLNEGKALIKYLDDVILALNESKRLVVLGLNLNKSNLPLLLDFPLFINNFFENYIVPITLKKTYNAGEEISFNSRGKALSIKIDGKPTRIEFPKTLSIAKPGIYEVNETLYSNKRNTKKLFIKISATESSFNPLVKNSDTSMKLVRDRSNGYDIYLYLGLALFSLLLLDRLLKQSKKM